jgi:hypothetical protein
VFLFVIYAVVVWYFAIRYRRNWRAFAAVVAGVAGLSVLAYLHIRLSRWTHGRIFLPQLQVLLYPYTVLVGVVGFYAACLGHRYNPAACLGCGYDRTGLMRANPVCPECGRLEYPLNGRACANCGLDLSESRKKAGTCPKCGIGFRPPDPPAPAHADPRRRRSNYPRRIRHASPHSSASSGKPATTVQRHNDN